MSQINVLLSAMYLDDESYIDELHISTDAVVINQCNRENEKIVNRKAFCDVSQNVVYIETKDRGLSRSRNLAIKKAEKEICILCDNDVVYVNNYEKIIEDAYSKMPDADIIVFFIKRPEREKPIFDSIKKMNYLSVLKIFSPEISFKKTSVNSLKFNEDFGAGSGKYIMGEENIFLYDALKKGLKIYYVPEKIAELKEVESTWFSSYDENFFVSRGANYAAMSKLFSHVLIMQFALRKRKLYAGMKMSDAIKFMYKGRKEYLSEKRY